MFLVRLFLIGVITIGTYLTLTVAYASAQDTEIAVSPIPEEQVAGSTTPPTAIQAFGGDLEKAIDEALAGTTGTYAVVVKDLRTGKTYTKNENTSFETASLYKLWVMGETYRQIADGTLTEETGMKNSVTELNKIFNLASESAELKEGDISLTVKDALEKMITVSDNYAAYLLMTKVKTSNVRSFVEKNNFSHSSIGPDPKTTASDMALFLEKLYKNELGSKESTEKMLGLLSRQRLNDRIPKYLPKSVKTMHKTGELGGMKHDVGIVSGPTGDYIIVLMSDSNNPQAAAQRLAKVSENVYKYFEQQ